MTESPKMRHGHPVLEDGTTDWEAVFEHEENGLIHLVNQTHDSNAIRQCAQLIIRKLFTRKNDQDEVVRLNKELDGILAKVESHGFEAAQKAVVTLLRRIKDERIRRARAFVERKKKKKLLERRKGKGARLGLSMAQNLYALVNNPRLAFATIAGLAIIGVAGVALYSGLMWEWSPIEGRVEERIEETATWADDEKDDTAPPIKAKPTKPSAPVKPLNEPEPLKEPEPEEPKKPKTDKDREWVVILRPIYVAPKHKEGSKAKTYLYQPFFEIGEKKRYIRVCRKTPLLLDLVNLLLDRHHPPDRPATKKELAVMAKQVQKLADEQVGKNLIRNVVIVGSDDPRYLGMKRPPCN